MKLTMFRRHLKRRDQSWPVADSEALEREMLAFFSIMPGFHKLTCQPLRHYVLCANALGRQRLSDEDRKDRLALYEGRIRNILFLGRSFMVDPADVREPHDESSATDGIDWVVVTACYETTRAHLARLRLEGEGIAVLLEDEHAIQAQPLYGPALGGVKVRVPAGRLAEARRVLDLHDAAPSCPACASVEVGRKPFSLPFLLAGIVLLTLPLWIVPRPWQCRACGHEWR
jgi:hypothetical protein